MAQKKYDDLSKAELVRLLESRDRRDATRVGLVWEANEIEREKAINADFVALPVRHWRLRRLLMDWHPPLRYHPLNPSRHPSIFPPAAGIGYTSSPGHASDWRRVPM